MGRSLILIPKNTKNEPWRTRYALVKIVVKNGAIKILGDLKQILELISWAVVIVINSGCKSPSSDILGCEWACFMLINSGSASFFGVLREDLPWRTLDVFVCYYALELKTDQSVIRDLPAKTEMTVCVRLSMIQRRIYDKVGHKKMMNLRGRQVTFLDDSF